MNENKKIARVCWNTEGWRKPSGPIGKSKDNKHKPFEYQYGYGHEEWLLDITKLISGWHYAFLQPVGKYHNKYIGSAFDIALYSINQEDKKRWWIGRILNVYVISTKESQDAYAFYKTKGWLAQMKGQLEGVGVDPKTFSETKPKCFFNIKYELKSLKVLDIPKEFDANDKTVTSNHYVLLNQKREPKLLNIVDKFHFAPGHQNKASAKSKHYEDQKIKPDQLHDDIQKGMYKQLKKRYGSKNVATEQKTTNGTEIDVAVRDTDRKLIFFEIKTSYSVKLCIREALGQLLEYAYYPHAINPKNLIIVSQNKITKNAKQYLSRMRNDFNVPVYYQQYDPETDRLMDIE